MLRKQLSFFALLLITAAVSSASAQNVLRPSTIVGEVESVGETKIVIKAPIGTIHASILETTEFKRVSAEKPSLQTATPAERTDVAVRDKIIVTGVMESDGKTLPARAVYVMKKDDIAQKQAKESAAWTTNGVSGKISAIDAATGKITVEVREVAGTRSVSVEPASDAIFKRYAPNSIKYSEAVSGTAADIRVGDMLRARGEKNSDGSVLVAEEIITGAFRTVAGTVKSVDVAKNEIVITDIETAKDVTVSLATATTMKKFPEQTAMMLAAAQNNGGERPAGQRGERPAGQRGERPAGQRPMGGRPGGEGGIDAMLERFPTITAADIKPGEMIAVSSTAGSADDRINAIKLLAGVEPFLRAAGSGRSRGGSRGAGTGFTIPGLDDSDF